jgi:ABC-type multidrug transport system permease subunit
MGWLLAILASGFGWLLEFFGKWITKRFAVYGAYLTFLITGVLALQVLFFGLFTALHFVVSGWMNGVLAGMATLLPSNFGLCWTTYISARIALWVWREQKEAAKVALYVT